MIVPIPKTPTNKQIICKIEKLDRSSDSDIKMSVEETFQSLLGTIQNSCLNFKIEISPFSANISIRKSFITDKKGNAIVPPEHVHLDQGHLQAENNYLINKVCKAECELNSIRCE